MSESTNGKRYEVVTTSAQEGAEVYGVFDHERKVYIFTSNNGAKMHELAGRYNEAWEAART